MENKVEMKETEEKIDKPSYTYWKRDSDKPFSTDFTPQKSNSSIAPEDVEKNNTNGSVWNKAGTWEEKHFNKNQIENFFNKSLTDSKKVLGNFCILEKVGSFSGDCYSVFVRGKKSFIYDCSLTVFIKGMGEFEEITGEVKLSEVTNHSEDDDFEFDFASKFKPEDNSKSSSLLSKVKSKSEEIQNHIKQIFNQLKENNK